MKVFPQCGVPAIGLSFLVSLLLGLAMPSLAAEDKKVTEADPIASNAIKNEAEVDEAGMPITTPPIDLSNTEADEMAQSIVKIYTTAEKTQPLLLGIQIVNP